MGLNYCSKSCVVCYIINFCFKIVLGAQILNQSCFTALGWAGHQHLGTRPPSEKFTCYFKPGLRPWVECTQGETVGARESRVPRKDSSGHVGWAGT